MGLEDLGDGISIRIGTGASIEDFWDAVFGCPRLRLDAAELAQDARDAGQRFVKARPIVQWADRDVQTVKQEDIWANYEACMILISVTYNLHSHVYGQKGFRGLIRDAGLHAFWKAQLFMEAFQMGSSCNDPAVEALAMN
eukprot:s2723_g4.t1